MNTPTHPLSSNGLHKYIGLACCFLLAALAFLIEKLPFAPFTLAQNKHPIEAITLALCLGIAASPLLKRAPKLQSGVSFAAKPIMYFAIVLLGCQLNLSDFKQLSGHVLATILAAVFVCLIFGMLITRCFKINQHIGYLTTLGAAICGNAAIAASAPILNASETDTSFAMAATNLFGLLAIFIFPLLGHLMHLSQTTFGIWSGCSIQAVPQVVATAFSYGATAGALGTWVKLIRILLLGPVLLALTALEKKHQPHSKMTWTTLCPPFIALFFLCMAINSLGWLQPFTFDHFLINPHAMTHALSQIAMAVALAAIGLKTSWHELRQNALQPLLMAFLGAVVIASVSLTVYMYYPNA